MGILQIQDVTQPSCWNCTFNTTQLNFENCLPFLNFHTDPHPTWWDSCKSDIKRNCFVKKALLTQFNQDGAAAILNFEKLLPFLYNWTDSHQSWWRSCKFNVEHNCHVDYAHSPAFKMAAAAILKSELLSFLYYVTNSHQTWWDVANSM